MVNPGAFRGLRKEFLMAEKENYKAGMEGGYGADALAQIQRCYFKRFPVGLDHFKEPSEEHLAAVDDNTPDPDPEEPDPEKLSPEDYAVAKKEADHRSQVVRFRKAQIKRWLAYQYMKDQDLDPKESGAKNPFHSLLFTITGKEVGRPRRRTAVNVWRKTQRNEIEARVKSFAANDAVSKDRLAALRDKVAREMFQKLPASEQEHWTQQANVESEIVLEDWKRTMLGDPPNTAKDYQIAIQGLVRVTKPFLDFVTAATGWKASLIAGGPEPAQGGKLNVISIHSGCTPGEMKLNWGRALRGQFKKEVLPCFGDFLKMCYSELFRILYSPPDPEGDCPAPEACRARALPVGEGYGGLVEEECEGEGVDLDAVDNLLAQVSNTNDSAGQSTTRSSATTTVAPSIPNNGPSLSSNTVAARPANVLRNSTNTLAVPKPTSSAPNSSITSRSPFSFGPGRLGPSYNRVPPVRANPCDVSLTTPPSRKENTAPAPSLSSNGHLSPPSCPPTSHAPNISPFRHPTAPPEDELLVLDPWEFRQYRVSSTAEGDESQSSSEAPPAQGGDCTLNSTSTRIDHGLGESNELATSPTRNSPVPSINLPSTLPAGREPDISPALITKKSHVYKKTAGGVPVASTAPASVDDAENLLRPSVAFVNEPPSKGKKKVNVQRTKPGRKSSRTVEKRKAGEALTPASRPPKKKKHGWITTDDEGNYWNEEGKPCDERGNLL